MTARAPDIFTEAYTEARDRYLRTVPAPRAEGFACRRCGADVGHPCTRPDGAPASLHQSRADRWSTAHERWAVGAVTAGDNAVNVLHELARILTPEGPITGDRS
jgi:hypothetical protein